MAFLDFWDFWDSKVFTQWIGCRCYGSYGFCGLSIFFRLKERNKNTPSLLVMTCIV